MMNFINKSLDAISNILPMRLILFFVLVLGVVFLSFSIAAYVTSLDISTMPDKFVEKASIIVLGYLEAWGQPLSIYVTFLLAFAAFWVIADTRLFKYLDEKTTVLADLNEWAADTFRKLSIPAYPIDKLLQLKNELIRCRVELTISVANSIRVFAKANQLASKSGHEKGKQLAEEITLTDSELRNFINLLFNKSEELSPPNRVMMPNAVKDQVEIIGDGAAKVAERLKKLMEASSDY